MRLLRCLVTVPAWGCRPLCCVQLWVSLYRSCPKPEQGFRVCICGNNAHTSLFRGFTVGHGLAAPWGGAFILPFYRYGY